jgi:hypothetical protein
MRGLERAAAWLSLVAGGVHAMAGPEHFAEWWGYGLFFIAAAAAQVAYGLLLLTQGIEGWGGWAAVRGRVYAVGIVGNLAIVALWIVTRTVGIPAGPAAGEVEAVGVLDAASKVVEGALLIVLAVLWRRASPARGAAASGPSRPPGPA